MSSSIGIWPNSSPPPRSFISDEENSVSSDWKYRLDCACAKSRRRINVTSGRAPRRDIFACADRGDDAARRADILNAIIDSDAVILGKVGGVFAQKLECRSRFVRNQRRRQPNPQRRYIGVSTPGASSWADRPRAEMKNSKTSVKGRRITAINLLVLHRGFTDYCSRTAKRAKSACRPSRFYRPRLRVAVAA